MNAPVHAPDTAEFDLPGRRLRLLASVPLALHAFGGLLPGPLAWAVNHHAYASWPPPLGAAWAVLLIVLIWSPAGARLGAWLVGRVEPVLLGRPLVALLLVPLAGMAGFWLVRARTPLLGDGMLLSQLLAQGDVQHGFDFMAYHVHARLVQLFAVETPAQARSLLAITSIVTGGAYLAAAGWAARALARRPGEGVLLWGLLVIAAPLQLFLGYVECYAQLAVCLVLFGASLLRYLDGRGSLLAASAWFAGALFWHLNALFVAPLLLAAALRDPTGRGGWPQRLATVAWPSLAALAAAWSLLAAAGLDAGELVAAFVEPQRGRRLLNAFSGPRGLTDWRLWKDVGNLALLLVPVPLALLVARGRGDRSPAARLLTAGAVWLLVLAVILHLKLGVARDWDLFAGHALLVALAAFATVRGVANLPIVVGVVWLAGLGLLVPWVAVNADDDAGARRAVSVTADLPPYPRGLVLEDLGRWYREEGDLAAAADAYRDAAAANPAHARFHLLHGQLRCEREEYALAIGPLRRALSLDPDDPLTHRMLLLALSSLGRSEAALAHARALAGTTAEDFAVARAHGLLAEQTGVLDEALAAYARALRLAPDRHELIVRIGALELAAGRPARAEAAYREAITRLPTSPQARLGLARALWSREQAADAPDAARLEELLGLLDSFTVDAAEAAELDDWRRAVRERLRAAGD